jgi:hypothetical protein
MIHMGRAWLPSSHKEWWMTAAADFKQWSRPNRGQVWCKCNETAADVIPWPLPKDNWQDFVSNITLTYLHNRFVLSRFRVFRSSRNIEQCMNLLSYSVQPRAVWQSPEEHRVPRWAWTLLLPWSVVILPAVQCAFRGFGGERGGTGTLTSGLIETIVFLLLNDATSPLNWHVMRWVQILVPFQAGMLHSKHGMSHFNHVQSSVCISVEFCPGLVGQCDQVLALDFEDHLQRVTGLLPC